MFAAIVVGVILVTINYGGWDTHKDHFPSMRRKLPELDNGMATLISDLSDRGLLDTTLVVVMGEFGRTPLAQGANGRDHHPQAFSVWLAGGGVRGGQVYGATDEFGRRAEVHPTTVWDFYATVLHLLGFDHERFAYKFQGLDQRLTGVLPAQVIKELLA